MFSSTCTGLLLDKTEELIHQPFRFRFISLLFNEVDPGGIEESYDGEVDGYSEERGGCGEKAVQKDLDDHQPCQTLPRVKLSCIIQLEDLNLGPINKFCHGHAPDI